LLNGAIVKTFLIVKACLKYCPGCRAEWRALIMSFYSVIDTSFLGDFDIKTLQREQEINELDPKKLTGLIVTAEAAIQKRLQELAHDSDHHTERQVIEDALQSLQILKKQMSALPDLES
jgi:hypothetical protein